MSSLEKLESDYKSFIENIERMAEADKAQIAADLNALKIKAAQFGETT